jgi:large conductance mechanosensitive channel
MPAVGLLTDGIDFSDKKWVVQAAGVDPKADPEVAILYGSFINTVIQFLIIAFVIFLMVKAINSLRRQEAETPAAPPAPTPTEALLAEIRDALVAKPAAAPANARPAAKTAPAKKAATRKPAAKK